jgi:multidrug efflux pump subunit AcrA (membrane-fusion protein)
MGCHQLPLAWQSNNTLPSDLTGSYSMKKVLLILIMLSLCACSSKFAYKNLDWLVYWYMDDYVELNSQQESVFDEHFAQWMQWHQSNELARYVAHLESIKQDVLAGPVDLERLQTHLNETREHWQRVRDYLTPDLVTLAKKLTDEQVSDLFDQLAKENIEREQEIAEAENNNQQQRLEDRIDQLEEQLTGYIGPLTESQRQLVSTYGAKFRPTGRLWLSYRRHIQAAAKKLFDGAANNPNFEQELGYLLTHTDDYRSAEYKQLRQQNNEVYVNLLYEMGQLITEKQKATFIEKIDDMIEDLSELMGAGE